MELFVFSAIPWNRGYKQSSQISKIVESGANSNSTVSFTASMKSRKNSVFPPFSLNQSIIIIRLFIRSCVVVFISQRYTLFTNKANLFDKINKIKLSTFACFFRLASLSLQKLLSIWIPKQPSSMPLPTSPMAPARGHCTPVPGSSGIQQIPPDGRAGRHGSSCSMVGGRHGHPQNRVKMATDPLRLPPESFVGVGEVRGFQFSRVGSGKLAMIYRGVVGKYTEGRIVEPGASNEAVNFPD